jgi:uncharacterized protein YjiS (DUF1127 family)
MRIGNCCDAAFIFLHCIISPMYSGECFEPVSRERERDKMLTAKLIRWFRAWTRYRQSLRELAQLDDRELTDIGISRSEIPDIAWHDSHR